MSNDKKCSHYIYLLQEREFIKTKENVYKVGRTEKENHSRFNQYPKGSVLLFQMICNDCKNIERQIIKLFKEKFIRKKDIGNEYFEGNFQLMIDIIYSTIRNETKITDISSTNDDKNSENTETEYTITDTSSSNDDEKNSENTETEYKKTDADNIKEYIKRVFRCENIDNIDMPLYLTGDQYMDKDYNNIWIDKENFNNGNIDEVIKIKTNKMFQILTKNQKKRILNDSLGRHYIITSYDEWIMFNDSVKKVIITNKQGDGYLKYRDRLWLVLYDENNLTIDEKKHKEYLTGFIDACQPDIKKFTEWLNIMVPYINKITNEIIIYHKFNKLKKIDQKNYEILGEIIEIGIPIYCDKYHIFNDTIKNCYLKNPEFYSLKYNEYIADTQETDPKTQAIKPKIFNSENYTFTNIDKTINDKILLWTQCPRHFYMNDIVNIKIVDDILNSLINNDTKIKFKKLAYNVLVKQEEMNIFYEYDESFLSGWLSDLLYNLGIDPLYISKDSYDKKGKLKENLKNNTYKLTIINYTKTSIDMQIKNLCDLGCKNIIVRQSNKINKTYNIKTFISYLDDNKAVIMDCIKMEHNVSHFDHWSSMSDLLIFESSEFLLTNFLRWCCNQ